MKANLKEHSTLIYSLKAKYEWIFSSHLLLCSDHSPLHWTPFMSFCLFHSFCSALPNQSKVKCDPKHCSFPLQWESWAGLWLPQGTKQNQTWQCPLTAAWKRGFEVLGQSWWPLESTIPAGKFLVQALFPSLCYSEISKLMYLTEGTALMHSTVQTMSQDQSCLLLQTL